SDGLHQEAHRIRRSNDVVGDHEVLVGVSRNGAEAGTTAAVADHEDVHVEECPILHMHARGEPNIVSVARVLRGVAARGDSSDHRGYYREPGECGCHIVLTCPGWSDATSLP